jgi:hypothetical protein
MTGLVIQGAWAGLPLLGHLRSGGQAKGVILVVIKGIRAIRDLLGKALKVKAHGVIFAGSEDGEPPVYLLGRRAVPDVAVPWECECNTGREVSHKDVRGSGTS